MSENGGKFNVTENSTIFIAKPLIRPHWEYTLNLSHPHFYLERERETLDLLSIHDQASISSSTPVESQETTVLCYNIGC